MMHSNKVLAMLLVMPTDTNKTRPDEEGQRERDSDRKDYGVREESLFICILTFYSQRQLIADCFALIVNGTARIISSIMFGYLLQHQTLIGTYDACRCVVLQVNTLQNTKICRK